MQWNETPLHIAAGMGHAPMVALLLATPGVDPLAIDSLVRGTQRAFHWGFCPSAHALPSVLQSGVTPLEKARRRKHAAAAAVLEADPRVAAALAAAAAIKGPRA